MLSWNDKISGDPSNVQIRGGLSDGSFILLDFTLIDESILLYPDLFLMALYILEIDRLNPLKPNKLRCLGSLDGSRPRLVGPCNDWYKWVLTVFMIFVPMTVDCNANQGWNQECSTKYSQNNIKVDNILIRYFHRTAILSF